jgi:uncharacterized protein YndB with AHSA1/START domain
MPFLFGGIMDRIEREIVIAAPINRVWGLVSVPGWWIGNGDRSQQGTSRDGEFVVVEDPTYGRFPILPVAAEPPRYAAFRGTFEPDKLPVEGASTLVEFFLTSTDDGTLLRVVESGFDSLDITEEKRASSIDGNTKGWEFQLGVAKRDSEQPFE